MPQLERKILRSLSSAIFTTIGCKFIFFVLARHDKNLGNGFQIKEWKSIKIKQSVDAILGFLWISWLFYGFHFMEILIKVVIFMIAFICDFNWNKYCMDCRVEPCAMNIIMKSVWRLLMVEKLEFSVNILIC